MRAVGWFRRGRVVGARRDAMHSMARVDLPRLSSYLASLRSQAPGGRWSVWAGPVEGDPWLAVDADAQHYAASTMKLPLVMAAYRLADSGSLDLDTSTKIRNEFASAHDGSAFRLDRDDDGDKETWDRIGQCAPLRWLARRSIVRSGNLAANLVLDAVGVAPVRRLLDDLGCEHTIVVRGIEDCVARDEGMQNLATAADLARMLQALWADAHGTPTAAGVLTSPAAQEVLDVLEDQEVADALPRRLPPGTKVAHKSGWVDGVDHDAGVVFHPAGPFVFAMCTTSQLPRAAAADVIASAARAAWDDVAESGRPA
jgi:beta-lactamase class A